jgi:hypothetical protein
MELYTLKYYANVPNRHPRCESRGAPHTVVMHRREFSAPFFRIHFMGRWLGVSGNVHVLLASNMQHGRCAWTRDDAILGTAAQAVNLSRASGGERQMTPVLTVCVAPPRSLLLSRPLLTPKRGTSLRGTLQEFLDHLSVAHHYGALGGAWW